MNKFLLAPLLCLFVLWAHPARGHTISTSFVEVQLPAGDDPVALRWDLSLHDLVWLVFIDSDFDGEVTGQELASARPTLANAVLAQLVVQRGGSPCALQAQDFTLKPRNGLKFLSAQLLADCPAHGRLSVGGPLFMTGDPGQRVLLSVTRGADTLTGVLSVDAPTWTEPLRASAWNTFLRFIGEGVWHVLIGYDHIAFVLLLLLPSVLRTVDGKWHGATGLRQVARDLVVIVTAFTAAHSTTLVMAATGAVRLPAQPVEIAIALSIAVAAGINLMPQLSRLRLPLAAGFGLVHGFGFANVLGDIDRSGSSLLPLLAGFNIGVELAQLAIVAAVLPLIYLARGTRWYVRGVLPLGSCALGAAGLVWLVQRL